MQRENKLPRIFSLKNRLEIDSLFENGKRVFGEYFTLIWGNSDLFKYGVFVSGKAGSAVERNKIKRIFREAIRLNRLLLDKNLKMAILPKKTVTNVRFNLINDEISRMFRKLGESRS